MLIDQADILILKAFLGVPPREHQDITSRRIKDLARAGLQNPKGLAEPDIRELCRTVITHIVEIERGGIGV
jgi:hypothetical protein